MLQMLSYGRHGGWGVGGCDNVLDEYLTWSTELVAVVNMLLLSSGGVGWEMYGIIENHKYHKFLMFLL